MLYSMRIEDLPFEEDCLRVPNVLRNWTRYLGHLIETHTSQSHVQLVFERAVSSIPFSYKLWKLYLEWAESCFYEDAPKITFLYERAVGELSRFPRIWLMYAAVACRLRLKELGDDILDRSLRSLPITQHERIWDFYKEHYCEFQRSINMQPSIVSIWKRWLQLHPNKRDESFAQRMLDFECFDEAAIVLQQCAQKSEKALGLLLELLSKHPQVESVNVDQIIRKAIKKSPSSCGPYWNVLAARAIKKNNYRTAQAIFEEALVSVASLEDFCLIYEAFSLFLETLASNYLGSDHCSLYLCKLERLLLSRQHLLTDVLIRLQPNNIQFWTDRLKLFESDHSALIHEYERAVKAINSKGTLQFHLIWIDFAKIYLANDDLKTAREILEHAASSKVRLQSEDHACLLIKWAELELNDPSIAIGIISKGCNPQSPSFKSRTLWNYLVDLCEAVYLKSSTDDHLNQVISTYQKMIDLKLATVQTFVNYAEFVMHATKDVDRQFAIFERGIASFGWPVAFELWNVYLPKAMEELPRRPLGVERLRDLFDQALHGCPDQYAPSVVLLYCRFEENHGLARNTLRILDSAVKRPLLSAEDKASLFGYFINKTKQLSDITDLRSVYERATRALSTDTDNLVTVSLGWASLEASLGELTRTRALLVHIAEQASGDDRLWDAWETIEKDHGDERSFRDMLRLKRAILDKQARRHGHITTSFVPATSNAK